MTFQKLSKRQLLAMSWWARPQLKDKDAIICDGAIRSGKTLCMAVGFVMWAMHTFDNQSFCICGKTIESLRRNIIILLPDWVDGLYDVTEKRAENKLIISGPDGKVNTFYMFGGRDESSYTLVQGMTLAGAFLDEVALMPRSFVEQVLARCSVPNSKFWFNCNPHSPQHWFYQEWILKKADKNALHLHFTMADNYALDPKIRKRYEAMYTGVFYRRYIGGEWCLAEGLVYPFVDDSYFLDSDPKPKELAGYYISLDYGTLNPFAAQLWKVTDESAIMLKEYYYSGRNTSQMKTDAEYYLEIRKLAAGYDIEYIVIDPSAASMIALIRREGQFRIRKAKNSVLDGIRVTSLLLKTGRIKFLKTCENTKQEFGLYSWDEKSTTGEDKVIKTNDHAMDALRYFCMTILKRKWAGSIALPPEEDTDADND